MSRQRVSPDSTYKIYSALAALDAGVISPGKSEIAWDQKQYPFSSWNKDQTLDSAMSSSVNWYFQTLDKKLGKTELQKTLRRIRYGNEDISGGITSFWLESSLKISPLEQVILLRDFDQTDSAALRDRSEQSKIPSGSTAAPTAPCMENRDRQHRRP